MKKKAILLFLAGLTFMPGYVKGSVVFYTDRTAWENEINSDISIENFDSVTPGSLEAGVNNVGLISIELLNHTPTTQYNLISDISYDSLSIDGTPFFRGRFFQDDIDSVTNLILPNQVYAFGADFYSAASVDGLALEINGAEYSISDLMPSDIGSGFLGFISQSAFSTVRLFDPIITAFRGGESFGLDNVSFAVPEPATLGLLGLGGFCLSRRRKSDH